MVPHYIQPPCISAHNNPLGFYIQRSVYISRMIICISNKHTCFPSVVQLGSHLFPFIHPYCETMNGGFVLSGLTIILSKFVAVEMTSHQNYPFYLALMPACINIALALPTSVGIFPLRCCKFKNHIQILFVTFFLETSVFSTVVQPFSFYLNSIFSGHSLYQHWYHFNLVTFLTHKKL